MKRIVQTHAQHLLARNPNARFQEDPSLHQQYLQKKEQIEASTPQVHYRSLRILSIIAIATLFIAFYCKVKQISFPTLVKRIFTQRLGLQGSIFLASIGLLFTGASIIIYRVTRKKGKFWGDQHYQPIVLKQRVLPGKNKLPSKHLALNMVDLSLLQNGSGLIPVLNRKEGGCAHDQIALSVIPIAPLQTVGAVVYNAAIRPVVVSFYIAFQKAKGKNFEWADIPKQVGFSFYWALRAPFYGTAYLLSALYSLIDPPGGRKLARLVCEAWMGDVDRDKSLWPCGGPFATLHLEGGGNPGQLGQHATYWTGCWMRQAWLQVENYEIKKAYFPDGSYEFDVYTDNVEPPTLKKVAINDSSRPPLEVAQSLQRSEWGYMTWENKTYIAAHVTALDGTSKFIVDSPEEFPKPEF